MVLRVDGGFGDFDKMPKKDVGGNKKASISKKPTSEQIKKAMEQLNLPKDKPETGRLFVEGEPPIPLDEGTFVNYEEGTKTPSNSLMDAIKATVAKGPLKIDGQSDKPKTSITLAGGESGVAENDDLKGKDKTILPNIVNAPDLGNKYDEIMKKLQDEGKNDGGNHSIPR